MEEKTDRLIKIILVVLYLASFGLNVIFWSKTTQLIFAVMLFIVILYSLFGNNDRREK